MFADIVNTLLFDGREVVDENDLISSKDRSQLKADDGTLHEQERDVAKIWKKGEIRIAFLSDEKVQQFKSDFGIVADFFVQKRKNNGYIPSTKQIKYVDEFLKLMQAIQG